MRSAAARLWHLVSRLPRAFALPRAQVEADALLGGAQCSVRAGEWEAAEAGLSAALAAAEAVGGERHARVAAVLLPLGHVFCRTARVTFAEGLHREAAKLLGLDVGRLLSAGGAGGGADAAAHRAALGPRPLPVHGSLAAALCWRNAQLLTALPKRDSEAGAWSGAARALWPAGGGGNAAGLQGALGTAELYTGRGQPGAGAVVSLQLRRLLLL